MPESQPPKFFTQKQAAAYLDMDPRTFRRYVDAGLFIDGFPNALDGNVLIWSLDDLEKAAWAYERQQRYHLHPAKEPDS